MILYLPFDNSYSGLPPGKTRKRAKPRPSSPCLLPGCGKPTSHRGGYCCKEHCAEHKTKMKGR